MSGLRGITILLAIGSGPMTLAFGAPPEPPPSPEKAQAKPAEKSAALEYIKAGAFLFNKGQVDRASRYFQAADRYRSQLSENEQIVLEVYLEEIENLGKKRKAGPSVDAAVAPASSTGAAPVRLNPDPVPGPGQSPAPAPATVNPDSDLDSLRQPSRYATTDPKQRARWLLQESREQMALGHFDEAARKIGEAKAMDVKWGFLEETPDKTLKVLQKVMARAVKTPPAPSARPLGVRLPDANAAPVPR